jgi:hypothetical protein
VTRNQDPTNPGILKVGISQQLIRASSPKYRGEDCSAPGVLFPKVVIKMVIQKRPSYPTGRFLFYPHGKIGKFFTIKGGLVHHAAPCNE